MLVSMKMDSNKEDITCRPSFFIRLLKDAVDYLPLPTDFAEKHLQGSISKKQTLVLEANKESGVKWSVRCLKIEDRYYLIDGWFNFMEENRLQIGDFLVFWLLSSSIFQVCIYEPNGCRKIPASFSGNFSVNPSRVLATVGCHKVPITFSGNFSVDPSRVLATVGCHKVPTTFSGESVGGDKSLKKPLVKEETGDDDDDLSENLPHSMTMVIKKSHIYKMPMKKNFLKAVRINGYHSVWLKNDDGKIWEAKVRKYVDEKMTYIGWFDFRKDNKMQIGDLCEFNHVKDNLIHVHVFNKH